eukprot:4845430-Pleurochrysis_carterae.AAC.1
MRCAPRIPRVRFAEMNAAMRRIPDAHYSLDRRSNVYAKASKRDVTTDGQRKQWEIPIPYSRARPNDITTPLTRHQALHHETATYVKRTMLPLSGT